MAGLPDTSVGLADGKNFQKLVVSHQKFIIKVEMMASFGSKF